jgi:hypothetical protein
MKGEKMMNDSPNDQIVEAQTFSPAACCIISANKMWQSAKLPLTKGDEVDVHAYGKWKMNPDHPRPYGPNGCEYAASKGYILPGDPAGCLCARIGKDDPFRIWSDRVFVADSQGDLQFITNDIPTVDSVGGFHDNTGQVRVIVIVKRD